jgi:hypothetical protein
MKFSTVASCLGTASCVVAFADSGKVYSNWLSPFGSIIDSSKLTSIVSNKTTTYCQSSTNQLFVYRVAGKHLVDDVSSQSSDVVYGDVHYDSSSLLDLNYDEKCSVSYQDSMDNSHSNANIVVVDLDEGLYRVSQLLSSQKTVIVQTKPNFNSKLDDIKYYLKDKLKRDDEMDVEVDEGVSEIEELMNQEFKQAEELISAEGDGVVNILDDAEMGDSPIESSQFNSTGNSNLFTQYQFFTPGLWSGLIVSGFLLAILYTAIGWVSSIEITYRAFEKQVDYQKKTE